MLLDLKVARMEHIRVSFTLLSRSQEQTEVNTGYCHLHKTHQARARSADRDNHRLAEALERMGAMTRPERQGHVKYFILQFGEIMEANGWRPVAVVVHLRESLKESAEDCVRARTIADLRGTEGLL